MILVIDNYDSFTWNLVHYLQELGSAVEVVRNDAIGAGQALSSGAEAFLISPGPCTPNEAGVSLDLVAACAEGQRPLLVRRAGGARGRVDARQDQSRRA
jgi:anthranilate synthase component 2